jgi:hypothetical protein
MQALNPLVKRRAQRSSGGSVDETTAMELKPGAKGLRMGEWREHVTTKAQSANPRVFAGTSLKAGAPAKQPGGLRGRHLQSAWIGSSRRREEILSSPVVFVLSVIVCFVGGGIGAYFYAFWTLGIS